MSVDWLGVALGVVFVGGLVAYLAAPRVVAHCVARREHIEPIARHVAREERIRALTSATAIALDASRSEVEQWTDEAAAWMRSCEQVNIRIVDLHTGRPVPDNAARDVAVLTHIVGRLINRHRLPAPIVEGLAIVAADVAERSRP